MYINIFFQTQVQLRVSLLAKVSQLSYKPFLNLVVSKATSMLDHVLIVSKTTALKKIAFALFNNPFCI
jgi:hypothetical protein